MSRIYEKDNVVSFQFLKIVGGIQTRDRNGVSHVRSGSYKKKTIRIDLNSYV